MNILVTGAAGFVGKNLVAALKNIRYGKDKTRPALCIDEIFEYDIDSPASLLDEACEKADFVFNLAGVNRPQNPEEFMGGNFGFASTLLDTLKKHNNTCPVMISSSIQATCIGRYDSDYGRSKKAGEELEKKRVQEYLFTASRICSASGADQITTLPLPHSAIILQTICLSR